MTKRYFCVSILLLGLLLVPPLATAADQKAEGELRWAMNYCGKVLQALERAGDDGRTPSRVSSVLRKLQDDLKKYEDYLAKAKALDPTVTRSSTIYDKKSNQTFAQGVERCKAIDGQIAEFQNQVGAANEAKTAAKEEAKAVEAKERGREAALDEAGQALGECVTFENWQGSSGLDERIAAYEKHKKAALELLPAVALEKHSTADGRGAEATKTFADWFAQCDKTMPAYLASLRQKEKTAAAAGRADADRRRAMNDRLRTEEQGKFNALVAATGGDRKRILQSKGFLPHWPRGGDLKTAPLWKWEVNITHEAQRCESYQFSGETLTKNSTSLGGCG